ncbi:MAG: sodium-translocating pyrophosphatase [Halobacteriota archaeon]|nr:sodium-translocating pyrophosphatase [Halobacteriota archaeon]
MVSELLLIAPISAILALIFAGILSLRIKRQEIGSDKMKEISKAIHDGAMVFLNQEYRTLIVFVLILALVLAFALEDGPTMALTFVIGAFFSALAGNIGMRVATAANARTANACKEGLNSGLRIAFSSGAVMGMCVVGLGVIGVSILFYFLKDPNLLFGFGFGASSIALFARVGGGIFTKGADVGADLVGKVEAGIPEDDPRNPATIADNVGDNVGDVAGMGADLFESYVDSIIATMVLGVAGVMIGGYSLDRSNAVALPLILAGVGILSSLVGSFFVRTGNSQNLHGALNRGVFSSATLMAVITFLLIYLLLGPEAMGIFYSTISGLVAGIVIGLITQYYTSGKPVERIAEVSQTGSATNIIEGLAVGMFSTIVPVIAVCAAIFLAYHFAGLYGIAIAAVGMLSTLGMTLATDTYGPVADNAAGIAEMAGMGIDIREKAEALDAVGNTTAAIGKGFAIGSAALTALALFAAYSGKIEQLSGIKLSIDVMEPSVMIGLFIGGLLPFVFSALTMGAVGRAAAEIVNEVRRQFKEIPGLMEGEAKPDYEKCVKISTNAALKEMVVPGVLAVVVPIVVGVALGAEALGGLLAGTIVTGFLLAVMMANAGGAWDNAKKYIEAGNFGGKGSETHKNAVVGDTVGDPFKDTSGPSLNILIKLMTIVALVFAPLFI